MVSVYLISLKNRSDLLKELNTHLKNNLKMKQDKGGLWEKV